MASSRTMWRCVVSSISGKGGIAGSSPAGSAALAQAAMRSSVSGSSWSMLIVLVLLDRSRRRWP